MSIKEFVDSKPSLSQIMAFIENEAQRIAKERQKQAQAGSGKP